MSPAPGRPHPLRARRRRLKSAPRAGRGAQRARPPPVRRRPAMPQSTWHRTPHRFAAEDSPLGPFVGGRRNGSNIKAARACEHGTTRVASQFERSFEIMRPYDERLDHLLARAARVFADKGYHPTTMRDLSAASGMSLAGMYYYVRGKEDLLALIQERCFTQVLEGARQAVASATDPQERLQAFIRHHVSFFAQHMAEMKVLSHEASPRGVSAIKRRYVDLLESILKEAAPEQSGPDRSAATYILFGMMNWIYNWYDPAGAIDPARLADLMASIFLGGFVETHPEAK